MIRTKKEINSQRRDRQQITKILDFGDYPNLHQIVDVPSPPSSDEHSLSITAKMDQLNRQIEKQKAEIAIVKSNASGKSRNTLSNSQIKSSNDTIATVSRAGFQGLPKGIASILFGEGHPAGPNAQEFLGLSDIHEEVCDNQIMYRDPRKNQPRTSSPKMDRRSTSLSSLTDADLLAKAAAQLPNEVILPPNRQFSQGINLKLGKKSKYPPLIPELSESPITTLSIRQEKQPQRWQQPQVGSHTLNQGYNERTERTSQTHVYDMDSEAIFQKEYWEPSDYYEEYEVAFTNNPSWSISGGHANAHGDSNQTCTKEVIDNQSNIYRNRAHVQKSETFTNNSHHELQNPNNLRGSEGRIIRDKRKKDSNDAKNCTFGENYPNYIPIENRYSRRMKSGLLEMMSDPRPPGEEDRPFDRSFHKSSNSRSRSTSPSEKKVATKKNPTPIKKEITETVTDIVARISN